MDKCEIQQSLNESVETLSQGARTPSPNNPELENDKGLAPTNYDELFPALPGSTPRTSRDSPPINYWSANNDMKIESTTITQVFQIPLEERARHESNAQFGENIASRMCSDISVKTGANIELSVAKDQSLTFVVTGKNSEVEKAKKLIFDKFQTPARQIVKIPKEHHKFILGKQYKNLKQLETSTGTKIQVPAANSDSEEIIVIGPREATEKAVHEIQATSDEKTRQTFERVQIPKIYHPFVSANEEIGELVASGSMRLNVPQPIVDSTEIYFVGEKDVVAKAKDIILKLHQTLEKTCKTVSIEASKSQHRFISGSRGSGIMEILKATGVSVEIPPDDVNTDTITLRGPEKKLGEALTLVYTKANSVKLLTIKTAPYMHKFIIGKKGANIKQLTQDYPKVNVEFNNNGEITLKGPPEVVDKVEITLKKTIDEFTTTLDQDTMPVDPMYYKHIIGKGGVNIQRIRQDTGTMITFSELSGKHIITIEGPMEGVKAAKQELRDLVKKMENEKEKVVHIDQRFHRNLIGQKGETIKEVRDQFQNVQISFPDPGEKSACVRIKGPKESVEACGKHLMTMTTKMKEDNHQVKVSLMRQHHKFIVGKNGATINKIREETNTRIELPTEGQNCEEILITGRKEDCERAKEKILKIKGELASCIEIDLIIPSKFHNSIIGAGGKQIQTISEDCGGVSIKFPSPNTKSDKVTIRGNKDDVQKAKQILVDLTNEKEINGFMAEVRAKPDIHRFLIGRNGANIKKIREKTGTRISFPVEQDTNNEVITIVGKKESVKEAKQELEEIIKNLANVTERTINVDPKHHRYFVSRRGEILRQISDKFGGVTISFPRQGVDSSQVTLKGTKDCVDAACNRIHEIVKDLQSLVTIEVEIPQVHHRVLMGARGSKVQGISMDHDVQIRFPDRDLVVDESIELVNGDVRPQDKVSIQGKHENCLAAKESLLAAIPVTDDVEVPFKYHRHLIGSKGEAVKQLSSDFDVQIKVPPMSEQKDIISVHGLAASVAEAKEAILKKVEEFKAEEEDKLLRSFTVKVRVASEHMAKIIGKKGSVINKIREKYNVNVQFPSRGASEDDLVTITGYEKNCDAAHKAILEITGDLDTMVKDTMDIDARIHSRLIGTRGRAIRKVMEKYKVDIKFPRGDDNPDQVVIVGQEENVEECKDHLNDLMEEFMQDLSEREDLNRYISGSNGSHNAQNGRESPRGEQGFVVTGAPWTQPAPKFDSSEDFPSMGATASPSTNVTTWGPKKF